MSKEIKKPTATRKQKQQEPKKEEEDSPSSDAEGTIRCPCNNNSDHGLMVQCEKCEVWQHATCFGLREEKSIPENFFCERCQPRNFRCLCEQNTPNGKMIACSKCKTWQHTRCLGKGPRALPKPYICPNCDPEGFASFKKEKINPVPKKKTKKEIPVTDKFPFIKSNPLREELERDCKILSERPFNGKDSETTGLEVSRLLEKYCLRMCDEAEIDLDDLVKGVCTLLEMESEKVKQSFGEIALQIYSVPKLEETLDPWKGWSIIERNTYSHSSEKEEISNDAQTPKSAIVEVKNVAPKGSYEWGLILKEPLKANQFIIEYLGEVVNSNKMDYSRVIGNPHLLYHNGVSIDARKFGNKARFIRRSCRPNAEIKEIKKNNRLHFHIFSKHDISDQSEVTIAFDYPWKTCINGVECACNQRDCPVSVFYKTRRGNANKMISTFKPQPTVKKTTSNLQSNPNLPSINNTNSVSTTPFNVVSQVPSSNSLTSPGGASVKLTTSPELGRKKRLKKEIRDLTNEIEVLDKPTSEKLGREERKIAMLMKSFKEMENRQNRKRKKDPKDITSPILSSPSKELSSGFGDSLQPPSKKSRTGGKGRKGFKKGSRLGHSASTESVPSGEDRMESDDNGESLSDRLGILSDDSTTPFSPNAEKMDSSPSNSEEIHQDHLKREHSPSASKNQESESQSRHKFGKKAWILEYQEEEKSREVETSLKSPSPDEQKSPQNQTEEKIHKFPVKKKFLDNFYSEEREKEREIKKEEENDDPKEEEEEKEKKKKEDKEKENSSSPKKEPDQNGQNNTTTNNPTNSTEQYTEETKHTQNYSNSSKETNQPSNQDLQRQKENGTNGEVSQNAISPSKQTHSNGVDTNDAMDIDDEELKDNILYISQQSVPSINNVKPPYSSASSSKTSHTNGPTHSTSSSSSHSNASSSVVYNSIPYYSRSQMSSPMYSTHRH